MMGVRSLDAHYDSSITLEGLASAIVSMRWADLEEVCQWLSEVIEDRGESDEPVVDGHLLLGWAESQLQAAAEKREAEDE